MKRWHKSMKRKPKAYNDILILWNDGTISIDELIIDDYGKSVWITDDGNFCDWSIISRGIKQWVYIDDYFKKERELLND